MPKKRPQGRPPVDPAYKLRARAWFIAVSRKSRMNEIELEVFFGKERNRDYSTANRPGLWKKYKTGLICPKYQPDALGNISIVQLVEKYFPKTATWMSHPFWDVLSFREMDLDELKVIFYSLKQEIREQIVYDSRVKGRMFWRRDVDNEDLFVHLAAIDDIDAATALLALIREAEIRQDQYLHKHGLSCLCICINTISDPVIVALKPQIQKLIEDKISYYKYNALDGSNRCEPLPKKVIRSLWRGYYIADFVDEDEDEYSRS